MRRYFVRYKWWIVVGLIALVVVPVLINLLFKVPALCEFFRAEWEAADVLAFYGTLLASVATILGVYWSIRYAQSNYREDERNRVRPYFALTHLKSKSTFSMLPHECNPEDECDKDKPQLVKVYEEYRVDRLFIILGSHSIQYKYELTQTQKDILTTGGTKWEEIGSGGYALTNLDYISMPFEVENVGNGAALCFYVGFYADGDKPSGINVFTMKQNSNFYVHIFSNNITEEQITKEYWLELAYRDIYGTQYSQKYPVKFGRDEKTKRIYQRIDLTGEQMVINK